MERSVCHWQWWSKCRTEEMNHDKVHNILVTRKKEPRDLYMIAIKIRMEEILT